MGDSVAADQQPNGRFMLHLPPGTVVEALFEDFLKPQNNAFYDGRVRNEVKDGVYHVDFVDGDVDEMCPEWKLRPINVVQFGMLPNGCDVRAKWEKDNLYYDAKVLRANASNKTYDIQFKDDGNLAYGVPVTRLRYSSAFTRSEEITEGMIVLVQWSLSCFAPGRVVTKNKDRTFHVRSLNFETRRATLQQLTRVYGYVPVRLLGEPDTLCSGCGKDDPKGKLATCDWCKCSYHPGCAPNSIPSGKTYYCKACVGLDRSKPRTEELPPLQSIYPLIAPPSQGASANNSKPKPRSRSNSKGQKRGAGSQSSENEDDNAPLKKPKNAPNKKSSRTSKPPSMATGESSGAR